MITIIENNTPFSSQNYTQVFFVILGFPLMEINCNTSFQRTCLRLRSFFRLLPDSKYIFFLVTFDCKLPIWNGPRIFYAHAKCQLREISNFIPMMKICNITMDLEILGLYHICGFDTLLGYKFDIKTYCLSYVRLSLIPWFNFILKWPLKYKIASKNQR